MGAAPRAGGVRGQPCSSFPSSFSSSSSSPSLSLSLAANGGDRTRRGSSTMARSDTTTMSGFISFSDLLTGDNGTGAGGHAGGASRFPVDQEINAGQPWNLEVNAAVNSTNESLDEVHSSPGLHAAAAAGSGLAEECVTLGGCRTGMAKMTNAYDLPAS